MDSYLHRGLLIRNQEGITLAVVESALLIVELEELRAREMRRPSQ